MRRRLLLLTFFLVLVVVLVLVCCVPSRIPRYHGRPVTYWIQDIFTYRATQTQKAKAEEAVRVVGTNALDYWMELLSTTNEPRVIDLWNSTIGRSAMFHRQTMDEKRAYAFYALYSLGPDAEPALPKLAKMLDCRVILPNDYATVILLGMGSKGIQTVTNALADTNCPMRGPIARSIGDWDGMLPNFGSSLLTSNNGEWPPSVLNAVVPALERCLDDPDRIVRVFSAESLGKLHKDSEKIVPLLARNLSKATNLVECQLTLRVLGDFGTDAKSARAQVASFLNNTNSYVSTAASNALRKIDSGTPPK